MQPPDGCMEKVKELRITKAMSYKKIYEALVGEYPEITESWLSKWGRRHGLPLLSNLEPDGAGGHRTRPPDRMPIYVRRDVYELFEKARERLERDYKRFYAQRGYPPSDTEVLKDLLDKC